MRGMKRHIGNAAAGLGCALLGLCAGITGFAASERYMPPTFEAYQPILDRMPFGVLPSNFNAASADPATVKSEEQAKVEQQNLARQISMSAVNVTPDGQTAIGFTDLSAKPPINYFLLVGSAANGWKVISADYDEELATIEKDGVSITLKLGKGMVETPPPQSGLPAPATAKGSSPFGALGSRSGASLQPPSAPAGKPLLGMGPPPGQAIGSYKERLLERERQLSRERQTAAAKQREQLTTLAREAAQKEIQRREEESAQAATENAPQPQGLPMDTPPEGGGAAGGPPPRE